MSHALWHTTSAPDNKVFPSVWAWFEEWSGIFRGDKMPINGIVCLGVGYKNLLRNPKLGGNQKCSF